MQACSKLFIVIIGLFVSFFWIGCEGNFFDQRMNEGVIEYEVSYPTIDDDNIVKTFLPSTMMFTFKDNVFCSELNSSMSQFKVAFISNSNTHELQQIFKLTPKQLYAHIPKHAIDSLNLLEYGKVSIVLAPDTKNIVGMHCKKAEVWCEINGEKTSYDVFYTEDIKLEDPNWSLPFHEIKGVPLEYQVNRMGITMHFKAKKIQSQVIEASFFEKQSAGFKKVHYPFIEKELKSLADDLANLLL